MAVAPSRICDVGGWTDTWFAGHGRVCNVAVMPGAQARVEAYPRGTLATRVVLDAENFADRYGFEPDAPPGRHPLLEAAIDEVGIPEDLCVEVSVSSAVPAGCSTGTSAAVTVALIGALDALSAGRMTPQDVATVAHRIEVERLGQESGIQDQLCAAFGGISDIEIRQYPVASVTTLRVDETTWSALDRQLVLIYLGRPHRSSAVHERVIDRLAAQHGRSSELEDLRAAAERAARAISVGDLRGFGTAMIDNTATQERLHPSLISVDAHRIIDLARENGAWGWKVNGAGGDGGSVSLLSDAAPDGRARLLEAIRPIDQRWQVIPIRLSRVGLHISEA